MALASIRPMATLCAMNKIYTPGVIIRQTIWITEMPVKHCKLIIVLNIY